MPLIKRCNISFSWIVAGDCILYTRLLNYNDGIVLLGECKEVVWVGTEW